jgi:predicted ATPase
VLVQSVDSLNTLLLAGGRGGGKSVLLVWLICYFAITSDSLTLPDGWTR